MANKITLTYENGKFIVSLNENIIYTDKEMEGAMLLGKQLKNLLKILI